MSKRRQSKFWKNWRKAKRIFWATLIIRRTLACLCISRVSRCTLLSTKKSWFIWADYDRSNGQHWKPFGVHGYKIEKRSQLHRWRNEIRKGRQMLGRKVISKSECWKIEWRILLSFAGQQTDRANVTQNATIESYAAWKKRILAKAYADLALLKKKRRYVDRHAKKQ